MLSYFLISLKIHPHVVEAQVQHLNKAESKDAQDRR